MSHSLNMSTSYGLKIQASSTQHHAINFHSLLTGALALPNK